MAFIVYMNFRYNLPKTLQIANKLMPIKILTDQQVRHLPRWAHRRPIRIINESDSDTNNTLVKKLKIERESLLRVPVEEENQFKYQNDEFYRETDFPHKSEKETDFPCKPEKKICFRAGSFQPFCSTEKRFESEDNTSVKEIKDNRKVDKTSKTKKERKLEKKEEMKMNKLKESAIRAGVPLYTKLADDDPRLSKYMIIAKSKNKKVKRSHILLEGKRLIKDAIQAGYVPDCVFFSRVTDAADLSLPDNIELYKISYKQIKMWSDLSTSPGMLGFLKTPIIEERKPGKDALPLTIVCDNIRDPGNMGTILRGAAGVGCQKVILMKGCVDLWEPKVLRSGAGAHFRISAVTDVEWGDIESHLDDYASVFLADSNAFSSSDRKVECSTESNDIPVIPYFATDYPNCGAIVLIIGGETEGLSVDSFKVARERGGIRLNIPLSNEVESLNSGVALGIITFEMKRQFLRKMVNKLEESSEEIKIDACGI